jgi:hypothetical protein
MLQAVKYFHPGRNPESYAREIKFTMTDASGLTSTVPTASITVEPINDVPTLSLSSAGDFATSFTEGGSPVEIVDSTTSTLEDVDDLTLAKVEFTILNLRDVGSEEIIINAANVDVLAHDASSVSCDELTISLPCKFNILQVKFTVTPSAGSEVTVAQFLELLRHTSYNNAADEPDLQTRVIETVIHDHLGGTALRHTSVTIVPVNEHTPVLAGFVAEQEMVEGNQILDIGIACSLSDQDHNDIFLMESATVSLLASDAAGDDFVTADTGISGITADFSNENRILTLSGKASVSEYEAVLQTF